MPTTPRVGRMGEFQMDVATVLAVFLGAGLGALARWTLGIVLNPLFPTLPLGTLTANVAGGLLMGVALGVFAQFESIPVAWRLAVTTGFLGGITTFSTYSAETVTLLLRGEYRWASMHLALHVVASLVATLAGLSLTQAVLRAGTRTWG